MACNSVTTGDRFLVEALAHLDCQAQSLGSFGFTALAQEGSPALALLTGLLTLFIAIFAYRLLFGPTPGGRDVVDAALKIGIVLTLAASWPAYRILAYDTVLKGPAEIAVAISGPDLPNPSAGFAQRLQNVDTRLAMLTAAGTGRRTGALEVENPSLRGFEQIAMTDWTALGWARTIYLASTIGSLAMIRVSGGLLLALAPIFGGLLLFAFSRGLFVGWLRGLVLVALGSVGITVLLAVEVAIMEPWLADALLRRSLGYATPTAPTEILALAIAFAGAAAGIIFLLVKVSFQNAKDMIVLASRWRDTEVARAGGMRPAAEVAAEGHLRPRAQLVSQSIAHQIEKETVRSTSRVTFDRQSAPPPRASVGDGTSSPRARKTEALGSSYRRSAVRASRSSTIRDRP